MPIGGTMPNNAGNEDCASVYGGSGRWNDAACGSEMRFACQSDQDPDDWMVTSDSGPWEQGGIQCEDEFPGYFFSTPGNAYHNRMIREEAGGDTVWIAYSDQDREGIWVVGQEAPPEYVTVFEEGFETPDLRTHGWTGDLNNDDRWDTVTYGRHSGGYAACFDSYNNGYTGDMISPAIDLSGTIDNELSFWVESKTRVWWWHEYYNHLYVYVSNDDGNTWIQMDHLTRVERYTVRTYIIDDYVEPTNRVRIKFRGQGGNLDDWTKDTFLDDVKINGLTY